MRDDLFDTLRTLPPAGDPLPPAEVRRRGDRLRRRRTTLQVVGAALVVAVIAGGAVTVADRITGTTAPPIEPPKPTRTTDVPQPDPDDGRLVGIPASFPLSTGWAAPGGDLVEEVLPGPEAFEFCGKQVELPMAAHWNGRSSNYPEDFHTRQLFVFESAADAEAAVERIAGAARACPTHVGDAEGGVAASRTEVVSVGGGVAALRWYEFQGELSVGAGVTLLYRTGNAVLTSMVSNEGAGRDFARGLAADEDRLLQPALAAMCLWSAEGCGSDGEIGSLPGTSLLTGGDLQQHASEFIGGTWDVVDDRDNPTMDCQGAGLRSLRPEAMAFREWEGPGESRAATAVLRFDEAQATEAYDTLVGWLDECPRTVGSRVLAPARDLVVRDGTRDGSAWRVYTGPAPEQCRECDAGWIDVQGVVKAGNQVAVVSVGGIGELEQMAADITWMDGLLDAAAERFSEGS